MLRVSDAMTTMIDVAEPNATIHDVAMKMRTGDVGAIPVNANGRLVGMITDRDIVTRAVADGRAPTAVTVGEIMSEGVVYCSDRDSLTRAAQKMAGLQMRRLPVIDGDQKLVGMLSLADIAAADPAAALRAIRGVSKRCDEARHKRGE